MRWQRQNLKGIEIPNSGKTESNRKGDGMFHLRLHRNNSLNASKKRKVNDPHPTAFIIIETLEMITALRGSG